MTSIARAALPFDFAVHDHRRTGIGRLENADESLASVVALYELASDLRVNELYQVRIASRGRVVVGRMWSTHAEDGPFEMGFVRLCRLDAEKLIGIQIFETEDLYNALWRLDA